MATLLSVLWFLASRWFLKTGMMLLVTCFGAACSRILEQLAADIIGSSRFREIVMYCVLLSGLLSIFQVFI